MSYPLMNITAKEESILLPFSSASYTGAYRSYVTTDQSGFYNATNVSYDATSVPYAEKDMEDSPLQRIFEEGGVGASYQLGTNNTTKYEYGFATSSDNNVFHWELTDEGGLKLADNPYFAANKLDVVKCEDPNWRSADGVNGTSRLFTDYMGRTLLSRVYDQNWSNF